MERNRQSLTGEVVSTKMDKTVVVKVTRRVKHKVYKKIINTSKKHMAHVTSVEPKDGDIVRISSIKPLSKNKRWQVSEIIRESVKVG
ncbi:MAG TPA: 30S ribosomal protein S17 [Candidatus Marinimicrobia bacterium]|jgi:small subunit ribosomal protein S17|nr:30S ribosomal protein S17 [Candidatus Neomarinimicrobiota bacterium]MDP6275449.1 30S ribosomal protein S17 [Candidatus Neomarinimicrobiota bacterium]MDP7217086.1 30S ribosomal protein S17 [Candidatus Neomarinimicrobiota bacterium]HJL75201.1 30S ribosomal protein S17 [Candidatus Neomarinimicrobiota bacterium]HJM70496.1 30S ribosomal protein S17 [Candidatus Neomarinimicrobiota bacterium]|tara:strand:- start:10977 stop:11237 length:261 start_codon:yes stop_codon:yes gene_type:complete